MTERYQQTLRPLVIHHLWASHAIFTRSQVIEETSVPLAGVATGEGFREVLIVKTAEAAANEELKEVTFALDTEGLTDGYVGDGKNVRHQWSTLKEDVSR